METDLKEKMMRLAILALEAGRGHLKAIEMEALAAEIEPILEKCNQVLMNLVPDAEPGILMKKKRQE